MSIETTTVSLTKAARKRPAKKAKGKPKTGAIKARKAAKTAPAASPYRSGGLRHKAHEAFLAEAKKVVAMEPGDRNDWARKLARQLGLAPITGEEYVLRFVRDYKA
jgi:hypothetical protein